MTDNTDNHRCFLVLIAVGALLCPAAVVGSIFIGFAHELDLIHMERSTGYFTMVTQCLLILILTAVSAAAAVFLAWHILGKNTFDKMSDAILSVVMYFCVVSAWAIALWPWLAEGADANSDTIAKIALASAALPTVLFVIWRERIASAASLDQRFNNAISALGNQIESVRIAGIHSLRQFRPYANYRRAARVALESHAATATGLIGPILSRRETDATAEAINHLRPNPPNR